MQASTQSYFGKKSTFPRDECWGSSKSVHGEGMVAHQNVVPIL